MKHNEIEISAVQSTIRTFDIKSCKFLAEWLSEHIKLMEHESVLFNKNIKELGLSKRSFNVLRTNGITSIDQLIKLSINWDNVKILRGAGKKVLDEIHKKISEIEVH